MVDNKLINTIYDGWNRIQNDPRATGNEKVHMNSKIFNAMHESGLLDGFELPVKIDDFISVSEIDGKIYSDIYILDPEYLVNNGQK